MFLYIYRFIYSLYKTEDIVYDHNFGTYLIGFEFFNSIVHFSRMVIGYLTLRD